MRDFTTGVTVRWPTLTKDDARVDVSYRPESFCFAPHGSDWSWTQKQRAISYGACQELAYCRAVEETHATIATVLSTANTKCFERVLSFMERFMAPHDDNGDTDADAATGDPFAQYQPFPMAAIVVGTDATASDVWMQPLALVLQRSFPVLFVLRDDFRHAREILEWLVDQLHAVAQARKAEEEWLTKQIETFDANVFVLDVKDKDDDDDADAAAVMLEEEGDEHAGGAAGAKPLAPAAPAVATRRRTRQQKNSEILDFAVARDHAVATALAADDPQDMAFLASDSDVSYGGSSDDDSDAPGGGRRRTRPRKRKRAKAASDRQKKERRRFAKWTVEELIDKIRADMVLVMAGEDPCQQLLDPFLDHVMSSLDAAVAHAGADVDAAIACFHRAVRWLFKRLRAFETVRLLQSTGSTRVRDTQFQLALAQWRVLHKFQAYLEADRATSARDDHVKLARYRRWSNVVANHREHVTTKFHLKGDAAKLARAPGKPFFLICVEQIEALNLQAFEDFVEIWTNYVKRRGQHVDPLQFRMGFVVGVASTSSPALRRLSLSVVSQIDMQFFSLADSTSCFDDIVESLVVSAMLPLVLSGDVLRWVAHLYRRTQSISAFRHALQVLFFDHFYTVEWSFLSRFGLDRHWKKPLQNVLKPSKPLQQWLQRTKLRGRGLTDYLVLFDSAQQDQLRRLIHPDTDGDDASTTQPWTETLDAAMAAMRRSRSRWTIGWRCVRAACAWLALPLQGDVFIAHLASALDGRLANSAIVRAIVDKLGSCPLETLAEVVAEWKTTCSALNDSGGAVTLDELALLTRYAADTKAQAVTKRMQLHLRQEIVDVFLDRIVLALVTSPSASTGSAAVPETVVRWMVLRRADLLERHLHLNYFSQLQETLLFTDKAPTDVSTAVTDASLAYHYYRANAGMYLSWNDWYTAFASDIRADEREEAAALGEKAATISDSEAKARFLRAFCTLRHWGFVERIKNTRDNDTIEKLVFL